MKLRFRVLSQAYNIPPSSYNAAVAGLPVNKTNISLLIQVNGVTLLNAGYATLTNGTTASVVTGPITSAFAIENTDYYKVTIPLVYPSDSALVRIKIGGGETHLDYDQTFTVWGYDLGINPNVSLPTMPTNYPGKFNMDLELVPRNFTSGGTFPNTFPNPKGFAWPGVGVNDIQVLKATSALGTYLSKVVGENGYGIGAGAPGTGLVSKVPYNTNIIMKGSPPNGPGFGGDDSVVLPPILAFPTNYVPATNPPTASGAISTPTICSNCDCIQAGSTVVATFNNSQFQPVLINDIYYSSVFFSYQVTFTLTNLVTGVVIDEVVNTIIISNPNANPAGDFTSTYTIPGSPVLNVAYGLHIKCMSGSYFISETDVFLPPCSYTEVEQLTCSDFKYTNKVVASTVKVYQLDKYGNQTLNQTFNTAFSESHQFTLADGVYIIEVWKQSPVVKSYSLKVIVHCTLTKCIVDYAKKLACQDPCLEPDCDCDCGCSDGLVSGEYSFGAFSLLASTYLSLINNVYATNWVFLTLSEDDLQSMKDIAKIQDRISKYCIGCN